MLDTKITGGTVVDGTGKPGFAADIGIRDGRIVAIGKVEEEAREVIDASGRVVSPGFVDAHTHYDAQVFWDPTLSPSCYHGVTTVVGGFCGFSIAPLTRESAPYIQRMLSRVEGMPLEVLEAATDWSWSSFGEYLDRIDGRIGINAGFFAGHSAIRRAVMGERAVGEKAAPDDIENMKALLDRSLSEGALGLSTTISFSHNDFEGRPVPSRWADREEFLELAGVVSRHDGAGLEMLPDIDFPEGVPELIADFSVAGQRPVNWNILMVNGRDNAAEVAGRQLAVTDLARERGGEVIALTVPCTPGVYMNLRNGVMFDALPGIWNEMFKFPVAERIEKFRDPAIRRQLAEDSEKFPPEAAMKSISNLAGHTVISTVAPENAKYVSRRIEDIAAEEGRAVIDVMLDIALADDLETVFLPDQGGDDRASWELRGKLWADDRTIIGASDAGAHLDLIDTFGYSTITLGKGVREQGVIGLEAAIHQLTTRPAAYFGLVDRGEIREGYHADLVVFDPETIGCAPVTRRYDLPGGGDYRLYAEATGIDHVLVNGVEIVRKGEHTGALPGTLLRCGRDTRTVAMDALRMEAA
ncbi:MAG: amidohydrolase family protein [Novosphingobium sp.]|nr:amidohydrolase family protein [Novosphingobium sp.]MCP5400968.1 amidohydrolase family protein [Novosphingobium sp.]